MNRLLELERSLHRQKQTLRQGGRPASPKDGYRQRMAPPPPPEGPPGPTYEQRPKPFYGTGEHVLTGEDLPTAAPHEKAIQKLMTGLVLEVGRPDAQAKRVGFTYGELIAMGDLYGTFADMNIASPAELLRLRSLIRQARDFHRKRLFKQGPGAVNPTDETWQTETSNRYAKLALENYTHFAPSDVSLTGKLSAKARGNHRAEWEKYHRQALSVARSKRTDAGVREALSINAFGDHFLTDAFAAGHLFNKADVAAKFNSVILDSQGKLNPVGKQFFTMVSQGAFKGPLKDAFSKYETVKAYGGVYHPSIDTAERFEQFLLEVHEAEPDLVGISIVARVIHDKLNEWPKDLWVTNDNGDRWPAKGDGTLDERNLRVLRAAIARSIYDVAIEAATNSNDNALCAQVWKYTPRLTPESKAIMKVLVDQYTQPMILFPEAIKVLNEFYPVLLKEAHDRGKLRPNTRLITNIGKAIVAPIGLP